LRCEIRPELCKPLGGLADHGDRLSNRLDGGIYGLTYGGNNLLG
jgi:hypothetical protein